MLAHLLLGANKVVSAEHLIDALWGADLPTDPRSTLQVYVSRLRSALRSDDIQARPPGYVLRVDRDEVDLLRFEDLLGEARANGSEPRATERILSEALELWRGPALADLRAEPSLSPEIARMEELRLLALEDRIDAELELGHHAKVVAELHGLTEAHPLRERLWGELMLALYRLDRQAEALAGFERARTVLVEELGIDPSAELRRLHERILRQDPDLDLQGEPLRGYRLIEQIGGGAFGFVYRATQPQIGREVAIKAVPPELANHPDFVRRFEREAQVVAGLEHPHVVPLYDYWREPDAAYLVTRFLRGGSLEERLRTGPLEPDTIALILDHVAAALSAAHRQGVVHRDVKPGNVLLDEEGNAYLTDFGVALDAGAPERSSGAIIRGSPGYLSPEQIRLDPASPGSDIYALGIVAYEMITGRPPFPESSLQDLLDHHLRDPVPSVRETRPELPAALDRAIERATAKDVNDRFPDALGFAAAIGAALRGAAEIPRPIEEIRNPYKGLRAFLEADAADFFGRETVVKRLLARLEEDEPASRFLAVVGPSGCGKSSVVRAGLVPALRRGALGGSERWYVIDLLPGPHPLRELESALLGVAVEPPPSLLDSLEGDTHGLLRATDRILPDPDSELLIVLDQLEEVFTLVPDEDERLHILESLRTAIQEPGSRVRVIATLRADFFDQPLSVRGFGDLLAERIEAITPMSPEELERAIVAPAERAGLSVEPRLLATMIADVVDQPGGLPLLQFTLTELAERRQDGVLTLAGYRRIGGVSGALARRAEQILTAMNEDTREVCRQLFLRLVTLGEGGEDTRRRVRRSELVPLADAPIMDAVLEAFGRRRLLSFDRDPTTREPTVEVAHEALLGGWDRLKGWIDDAREDIGTQRRLATAVSEWEAAGRDPSFLLRGSRLDRIQAWAQTTTLALSATDHGYVDESIAVQRAAQVRQQALERRAIRRSRALVAVFAVAALVAGTLTVVARDQSERAASEARIASARELAAAAIAELEVDPERSILLAVEAVQATRSVNGSVLPEAAEALHRSVVASRIEASIPDVGGSIAWSPKGVFIATGVGPFATGGPHTAGVIDIRDVETGEVVRSFQGHDGDINDVAFNADGSAMGTAGSDGMLKVWDPSTGALRASTSAPVEMYSVSFSRDGSFVAAIAAAEGNPRSKLLTLDLATERVRTIPLPSFTNDLAISPDGTRIAAAEGTPPGTVHLIEIATRDVAILRAGEVEGFTSVSWSPDGRYVAAGGFDTRVKVWDLETGRVLTLERHTDFAHWVDWSPDPARLVTGGNDGTARVWDIAMEGAREVLALSGSDGPISGVAFSPNGARVMTSVGTSAVEIWDVGPNGDAEIANLSPVFGNVVFAPDERHLVSSERDGSMRRWDLQTGSHRTIGSIDGGSSHIASADMSPDGSSVAFRYANGTVDVLDIASIEVRFALEGPISGMSWSPDGGSLATVGGGTVTISDARGDVTGVLQHSGVKITQVWFGPAGLIATLGRGDDEAKMRLDVWDEDRAEVVSTIRIQTASRSDSSPLLYDYGEELSQVTFDPEGARIATRRGGTVEIWGVAGGERIAALPELPADVGSIAFSPDGSVLAVGTVDGAIRLIDPRSGEEILLVGHQAWVDRLVFNEDGTMLASKDLDGTVRVWALDIDDLLEIARREVTRSLTDQECGQFLHLDACPG